MKRKGKWIMAIVLACVLTLSSVSSALAYFPNMVRVIIGFDKPSATSDEGIIRNHGGLTKHRYHLVPAIAAQVPETVIPLLQALRGVSYIELDGQVEALEDNLPWGVDRIDAERVWGGSEDATSVASGRNAGAGVKIAIIDTGIDLDHEDLNVVDGITIYGGTTGGDDDYGHGTHCAGIAAALGNGTGVIGVAPQAELYAVKVLNSSGSGYWSDVIEGIEWAVDHDVDIISMSLGSSSGSTFVKQACDNAYNAGVVVVAAAGNSGYSSWRSTVVYPARYDSAIAVAATDSSDNRASFSSTGPEVELAAPGVSIYSTYYSNRYATMSGTSMATPHVTGVAALVIASGITDGNNNGRINDDVRLRLQETADDLGALGRDRRYGYGLVDADEAAIPADSLPTVTITAPGDGATVSGTAVTVSANANDDNGITQVDFYIDGSGPPFATDTTTPYSCSWDSTTVADGAHNITAMATDTNTQTASDTIGVTVDNPDNPPTVTITAPSDGATNVSINTVLTATFSEAMDSSTITASSFTLSGSVVSGAVSYDPATYTATFTPDANLAYNATYTAALSTAIIDVAGNPLAQAHSWSFTTVQSEIVVYELPLSTGWNLVSLPLIPNSIDIEDILAGIKPSLVTAWAYDDLTKVWSNYNPEAIVNSLTEMKDGIGYWVRVKNPCTLTVQGERPTFPYEITLFPGWNLVGLPLLSESQPIEEILADIMPNLVTAWAYDGSTEVWSNYNPEAIVNSLTEMKDGIGYWVRVKNPCTLTIVGP